MNHLECIPLLRTSNPEVAAQWSRLCHEAHTSEQDWIKALREKGIKACHPDDGWVDRENNNVFLSYPRFNDGVAIGEQIALGTPDCFRIVRVTGYIPGGICRDMSRWSFEEVWD